MARLQSTAALLAVGGSLLIAGLLGAPEPAGAQGASQSGKRAYVCMAKTRGGDGNQPTRIVVPTAGVQVMAEKGFEEFRCAREGFTLPEQIRFRDMVCTIAAEEPEGIQRQFENILGERPSVLCGMAEVALGQWVNMRGRR